jgi:hypothetical protein
MLLLETQYARDHSGGIRETMLDSVANDCIAASRYPWTSGAWTGTRGCRSFGSIPPPICRPISTGPRVLIPWICLVVSLAGSAGCGDSPPRQDLPIVVDGAVVMDGASPDAAIPDAEPPPPDQGSEANADAGAPACNDVTACGPDCQPCPTPANGHSVCNGIACITLCDRQFHSCGDACVFDGEAAHCGARCDPCPVPPGGQATCDGQFCGIACPVGAKICGDHCIPTATCCTDGKEGCPDHCPACSAGQCTMSAPLTFTTTVTARIESILSDPSGEVTWFNEGLPVPPGRYSLRYLDGCMKFSSTNDFGWTVQGINSGPCCDWWLVGETAADRRLRLPAGKDAETLAQGAALDFATCVAANLTAPTATYMHRGGKLGIWLKDITYGDNVAGESGRNPRWELSGNVTCQ